MTSPFIASATLFTGSGLRLPVNDNDSSLHLASLVNSGAALWMVASGSVIYLFQRNVIITYLMLGFIASLIMTAATESVKRLGTAVILSLIYSLSIYVILVCYVGASVYVPIGPLPVFLTELAILMIARFGAPRASLIAGVLLCGVVARLVYYALLDGLSQAFYLNLYGAIGGVIGSLSILLFGGRIVSIYILRTKSIQSINSKRDGRMREMVKQPLAED